MGDEDFILISRYIDNELSVSDRKAVELKLRNNLRFKKTYDDLIESEADLKKGLNSICSDPLPAGTLQSIEGEGSVSANVFSIMPNKASRYIWLKAMAASILVIVGGIMLREDARNKKVPLVLDDVLFPSYEISKALSRVPSGQTAVFGGFSLKLEFTFDSESKGVCRQYGVITAEKMSYKSIACKQGEKWAGTLLVPSNTSSNNELYRTASVDSEKVLSEFVKSNIKGIPMSIEEERLFLAN